MKESFRRARRVLLLVAVLVLFTLAYAAPVVANATYCVAGSWQTPNAWDPAANPMTDNSDGTWSLAVSIASPGSYNFKVVNGCDWANGSHPGENSWFTTTTPGQAITFHFDTNSYSDGFVPASNIVHVSGDTLPSLTAVGAWQGWSNTDPNTVLTDAGGGLLTLTYAIANPGTYEAKISVTGDWDRQFTSGGRQRDGGVVNVTTTAPGETITVTLNTNTSRFRYVANGDGGGGGCPGDNNILWDDLYHDSRDTLYRAPGGAVPMGTRVTLRLRSAANDLTAARVRVWDDRADQQRLLEMTRVASDGTYDWWEARLNTGRRVNVFYYRFIVVDCDTTVYYEDDNLRYGGVGQPFSSSPDNSWQLTAYDPAFRTPEWVKHAIIYQIFPDRFRDGDPTNHTPPGSFFYNEEGGTIFRSAAGDGSNGDWNTPICDPRRSDGAPGCQGSWSRNFYGGDLQGLLDQLDYLQELGITAIYLNPIFESPSNHKYDTTDFSRIDDNFGDLKLFRRLVRQMRQRNMRLILDGVFNHTSSDSIYFDRYSRYPTVGACEKRNSPFKNWYTFFPYTGPGVAPCAGNRDYPKWFGIFDSLPVLRTAEKPAQDLIFGAGFLHPNGVRAPIGPYWAKWIDGWRLDVAPEVDHGIQHELTDPRAPGRNTYWERFRRAVHHVNPELYIVGEEWGYATSWTSGGVTGSVRFPTGNPGEWDATMNYQFSSALLSFWRDTDFTDNDHNTGSSAGVLSPMSPSMLNNRLLNLQERYAPEAFYAMMNLLGSHDTNRALFMLDHGHPPSPAELTQYPLAPDYDWSDAIARLKGVVLMQMTMPGAPTIYYGDEVGLVGPSTYSGGKWEDDPYNRVPYPWLDETGVPYYAHLQTDGPGTTRGDLFAYYQRLIAARSAHPALRTGTFDPLLADDTANTYAYGRRLNNGSNAAVVLVNRANAPQSITVNVRGYLPVGATFDDVMTDAVESYTVQGDGSLTVPGVAGRSGAVLVMTSAPFSRPARVTNLTATGGQSQVALAWAPASGATLYEVYRSLVSGGGYASLGLTDETSYLDTTVTNGQIYYYIVVGIDGVTQIPGRASREVAAQPRLDLSAASLKLQWPASIEHTISTTVRTPLIFGRIGITGITDQPGQTPGLRAQVGYGPRGTRATRPVWRWTEMSYNGDAEGADEYQGSLLPDAIGQYDYTVRFSNDNGQTWFLATQGPDGGAPIGQLNVIASADANRPSAPTELKVDKTTASAITLSWMPSTDTLRAPGVDSYRVLRARIQNGVIGAYSVVGTTPGNVTTFTDTSVVANHRYAYRVRAVDTSFNVSHPSNVVRARARNIAIRVTFITTVPDFTPGTVHIVGDQAVWGPWNPGLTPMSRVTGTTNQWQYTTEFEEGTRIEFKHTRGTWDMVEKQADGFGEISYFVTVENQGGMTMTVNTTLPNWRDPLVVSTSPAAGASVSDVSTIRVTWNKDMGGVTAFAVTNSEGTAVAGSYAYDNTTFTTTFTPSASLAAGVYNVAVTGFAVGGDTQQVDGSFSFTVTGD